MIRTILPYSVFIICGVILYGLFLSIVPSVKCCLYPPAKQQESLERNKQIEQEETELFDKLILRYPNAVSDNREAKKFVLPFYNQDYGIHCIITEDGAIVAHKRADRSIEFNNHLPE